MRKNLTLRSSSRFTKILGFEVKPKSDGTSYGTQIKFVADRPGHDFRYAIDSAKIKKELGWRPRHCFSEALRKTVLWYLDNSEWTRQIMDEDYRKWLHQQYQDFDSSKPLEQKGLKMQVEELPIKGVLKLTPKNLQR